MWMIKFGERNKHINRQKRDRVCVCVCCIARGVELLAAHIILYLKFLLIGHSNWKFIFILISFSKQQCSLLRSFKLVPFVKELFVNVVACCMYNYERYKQRRNSFTYTDRSTSREETHNLRNKVSFKYFLFCFCVIPCV